MKILRILAIFLGLGVTTEAAVTQFNVLSFGAKGNRTADDTTAVQTALTSAAGVAELYFPAGYVFRVKRSPVVPSNSRITGYGSVILQDTMPSLSYGLWMDAVTNVIIQGISIDGNFNAQTNTSYQLGPFGFRISNASDNIQLIDCAAYNCRSDGLYIGNQGAVPRHISLINFRAANNGRNGASITSGEYIYFQGGSFSGSRSTLPGSGIDFEPDNVIDVLRNITLNGCEIYGNNGMGFTFLGQMSGTNFVHGFMNAENLSIYGNGAGNSGYGALLQNVTQVKLGGLISGNYAAGLGVTLNVRDWEWDGIIQSNKYQGISLKLEPSNTVGVNNGLIKGAIINNSQFAVANSSGIDINGSASSCLVTNIIITADLSDTQDTPTQSYGLFNFDGLEITLIDNGSAGNINGTFNDIPTSYPPIFYQKSFVMGGVNIGRGMTGTNAVPPPDGLRVKGGINIKGITKLEGDMSTTRTIYVDGNQGVVKFRSAGDPTGWFTTLENNLDANKAFQIESDQVLMRYTRIGPTFVSFFPNHSLGSGAPVMQFGGTNTALNAVGFWINSGLGVGTSATNDPGNGAILASVSIAAPVITATTSISSPILNITSLLTDTLTSTNGLTIRQGTTAPTAAAVGAGAGRLWASNSVPPTIYWTSTTDGASATTYKVAGP